MNELAGCRTKKSENRLFKTSIEKARLELYAIKKPVFGDESA